MKAIMMIVALMVASSAYANTTDADRCVEKCKGNRHLSCTLSC